MARALADGGLDGVRGEFHEDPVFAVDMAEAERFDEREYPPKEPAVLTPLHVLDGHLPHEAVDALRGAGHRHLETVTRLSSREAAELIGVAGRDALGAHLRGRGVPWGPPTAP